MDASDSQVPHLHLHVQDRAAGSPLVTVSVTDTNASTSSSPGADVLDGSNTSDAYLAGDSSASLPGIDTTTTTSGGTTASESMATSVSVTGTTGTVSSHFSTSGTTGTSTPSWRTRRRSSSVREALERVFRPLALHLSHADGSAGSPGAGPGADPATAPTDGNNADAAAGTAMQSGTGSRRSSLNFPIPRRRSSSHSPTFHIGSSAPMPSPKEQPDDGGSSGDGSEDDGGGSQDEPRQRGSDSQHAQRRRVSIAGGLWQMFTAVRPTARTKHPKAPSVHIEGISLESLHAEEERGEHTIRFSKGFPSTFQLSRTGYAITLREIHESAMTQTIRGTLCINALQQTSQVAPPPGRLPPLSKSPSMPRSPSGLSALPGSPTTATNPSSTHGIPQSASSGSVQSSNASATASSTLTNKTDQSLESTSQAQPLPLASSNADKLQEHSSHRHTSGSSPSRQPSIKSRRASNRPEGMPNIIVGVNYAFNDITGGKPFWASLLDGSLHLDMTTNPPELVTQFAFPLNTCFIKDVYKALRQVGAESGLPSFVMDAAVTIMVDVFIEYPSSDPASPLAPNAAPGTGTGAAQESDCASPLSPMSPSFSITQPKLTPPSPESSSRRASMGTITPTPMSPSTATGGMGLPPSLLSVPTKMSALANSASSNSIAGNSLANSGSGPSGSMGLSVNTISSNSSLGHLGSAGSSRGPEDPVISADFVVQFEMSKSPDLPTLNQLQATHGRH
ncbi:hypothetical protein BC831DRAFT_485581 [Entophlyctis helioformis]|nr:hypothetical protein BC831DRAFT_485581 [Entophlyctis helioformis]